MRSAREEQLLNECQSDTVTRQQELLKRLDDGLNATRHGVLATRIMRTGVPVVAEVLQEHMDASTAGVGAAYRNWLRALDANTGAFLALTSVFNITMAHGKSVPLVHAASELGALWVREVQIREALAIAPIQVERELKAKIDSADKKRARVLNALRMKELLGKHAPVDLGRIANTQIGKFGIDALWRAGILLRTSLTRKGEQVPHVQLHPDVQEYLLDIEEDDVKYLVSRADLIMVCEPTPWVRAFKGGYLTHARQIAYPMCTTWKLSKNARSNLLDALTAENFPTVFEWINTVQSVPYTIHEPTKRAVLSCWDKGGGVLGIGHRYPPEPPEFPFQDGWDKEAANDTELEMFQSWKREKAICLSTKYREWREQYQTVGFLLRTMQNVESYKDKPLWFPTFIDTRGRLYYRGYPNPQGPDMQRGLLHFHEKKPLGKRGLYWLKVHIANSAGFDKATFDERAQWVDDNWKIISSALDYPEDSQEVFTDNPWTMFSAAWELREALKAPRAEDYCTGVPVHMDATTSGLQILSALFRDTSGGFFTNLTNSGKKEDLYSEVARVAMLNIKEDLLSDDPVVVEKANFALRLGISRSMAKRPVMTTVYGASLRTLTQYLRDSLDADMAAAGMPELPGRLKWPYGMYITKHLVKALHEVVPSADLAMQWLREVAKKHDGDLVWVSPMGLSVVQSYPNKDILRIFLRSCGTTTLRIASEGIGLKGSKMVDGISPNFVHSLDASHACFTALAMRDLGCSMVSIHDSFGTHPSDVDTMHRCIRESFLKVYSQDIVGNFINDTGTTVEPPPVGKLDLRCVLDSRYMFC